MAAPVVAAIPVIDLAGDQADVARQLVSAAQEQGFIYIRNLGNDITDADVDQAFSLASRDTHPVLLDIFSLTLFGSSARISSMRPTTRNADAPSRTTGDGPACMWRGWIPRIRR